MGEVSIKKNTVAEKASDIISVFLMLALVLITFFVYKIFITGNNKEYLSATLELLKMINSFLAIISVISCSILYKKTKKNTVFTLILVYIGLAIGIITDQFDYFTFISNEFYISDYIMISTSILRMLILYTILFPKSKLYKFIKENNGTFNIKIKDKKVEAKKIKGECDLHLSINTFTQLAFSYIDIKEAMILNNINKNEKNKEAIDLFEILFNKKENYINEYV